MTKGRCLRPLCSKIMACAIVFSFVVSFASSCVQPQANTEDVGVQQNDSSEQTTESIAEGNKNLTFDDLPESVVVDANELRLLLKDNVYVVDVRNRYDYAAAHIAGATNIAAGKALEIRAEKLPSDKVIVIVAKDNGRLAESWKTLIDCGFPEDDVKVLEGGMQSWIDEGLPTETTKVKGC